MNASNPAASASVVALGYLLASVRATARSMDNGFVIVGRGAPVRPELPFPIGGKAQPLAPGTVIGNFEVPDMYGRSWARIWETSFEQDRRRTQSSEDR